MTTDQAITEAKRRWGPQGNAWILRGEPTVGVSPFRAGVQQENPVFYGEGASFEEAFTDATNKGH